MRVLFTPHRPGPLSVMKALGNDFANTIWEARMHSETKPGPRSSREEKEKWIRSKYETRDFIARPQSTVPIHEQVSLSVFMDSCLYVWD